MTCQCEQSTCTGSSGKEILQEQKTGERGYQSTSRSLLFLTSCQPHAGPYTFASYQAWQHPGLTPAPSEALKLLHKLAADPGIVDVMKKNSWRVGKLSEMPPEGKEGISPMCILGVNINAGQEISLRLRTDDLKVCYLKMRVVHCKAEVLTRQCWCLLSNV